MTIVAQVSPMLVALTLLATPVAADEDWVGALSGPVSHLWASLPDGVRVAVRPLDPDESGVPKTVLIRVERALTAALLGAAPAASGVLTRRDLPAVWEEAASFADGLPQDLLASSAVDALMVPIVTEQRDGVAVAATLIGVRDGSRGGALGEVLATMPSTLLAADLEQADIVQARTGARRLGVALAEGLRMAADPTSAFAARIERRGRQSPAADWFAGMVSAHLVQRLASPPLYVARPVSRLGETPAARKVLLELDLWDQGGRVDVQARAGLGDAEAHGTVRVALTSIPNGFLPLTRDGGRVGQGLYRAVGAYAPAYRTDPREVRFAARVLARAALIEDGIGLAVGGGRYTGSTARDVAEAMRSIARGVPHEEIWRDRSAGNAQVQELAARLARIGGDDAPLLEASVDRALYRPGETLRARVTVRGGRAYIAAYAWQADDTVVRMAPLEREARLLEAERRAYLPGPVDAQVTAAPLPGSQETVEALLLVASAVPFAADELAPTAGASPEGSLAVAAEMSAFLDALAALDLSRISLAVLPYRTRGVE